MFSPEFFVYVDHEEREHQAQIIALQENGHAELMVYDGEAGPWTVLDVPNESDPERPVPGAFWRGDLDSLLTPAEEPTSTPAPTDLTPNPSTTDEPPAPVKPTNSKRNTKKAGKVNG